MYIKWSRLITTWKPEIQNPDIQQPKSDLENVRFSNGRNLDPHCNSLWAYQFLPRNTIQLQGCQPSCIGLETGLNRFSFRLTSLNKGHQFLVFGQALKTPNFKSLKASICLLLLPLTCQVPRGLLTFLQTRRWVHNRAMISLTVWIRICKISRQDFLMNWTK